MASYRVYTPVEGFTGVSAGVMFLNGEAVTDSGPAVSYFTSAGYRIEQIADESDEAGNKGGKPAITDNKAEWVEHAKTLLADDDDVDIDGMTKAQIVTWVNDKETK